VLLTFHSYKKILLGLSKVPLCIVYAICVSWWYSMYSIVLTPKRNFNWLHHLGMYFLINAHICICCFFCHGTDMQKCSQYMFIPVTDLITGAMLPTGPPQYIFTSQKRKTSLLQAKKKVVPKCPHFWEDFSFCQPFDCND